MQVIACLNTAIHVPLKLLLLFQLEGKKKKAEDAVKKADIEYYSLCVRAERARLAVLTIILIHVICVKRLIT